MNFAHPHLRLTAHASPVPDCIVDALDAARGRYPIDQGIGAGHLTPAADGASQSRADNESDEGRELNRYGALEITGGATATPPAEESERTTRWRAPEFLRATHNSQERGLTLVDHLGRSGSAPPGLGGNDTGSAPIIPVPFTHINYFG